MAHEISPHVVCVSMCMGGSVRHEVSRHLAPAVARIGQGMAIMKQHQGCQLGVNHIGGDLDGAGESVNGGLAVLFRYGK